MRMLAVFITGFLILNVACVKAQSMTNTYTDIKVVRDVRMYSGAQCLYSTEKRIFPAIAAAIVPALIEKSLTRLSSAIRKAGEKDVRTVTASTNIEVSTGDLPSCVQIIYGDFYLDKSNFDEASFLEKNPLLLREETKKTAYGSLLNTGAYVADKPLLMFEGYIRKSQDSSAIAFGPTALIYDSLIQPDSKERKKGTRDLVVTLTVSAAGMAGSQDKGSLAQLSFRDLRTDSVLRFNGKAPEAPWIPVQLTEKKSPRVMTLSLSETKNANEFLLFVADVLDGSKEEVETVLKQTLVESERLKAKQQEIEAEKQRQQLYVQTLTDSIDGESEARIAKLEFDEAVKALEAAPNDSSKKRDLWKKASLAYNKLMTANLKARNASIPEPFKPDVIEGVRSRLSN